MPAGILLFGATRGTGLAAAGLLAERGEPITAFVRPDSDMESLTALGANLVVGNVLDAPSVEVAFASGTFRRSSRRSAVNAVRRPGRISTGPKTSSTPRKQQALIGC